MEARSGAIRFCWGRKETIWVGYLHVDGNIILKCIINRMGVPWTVLTLNKHKLRLLLRIR